MTRRTLFMTAAVVAALVVTTPVNPQGMRQGRVGQFWGTFVHWVEFASGKYTGLVAINVDGTFRSGDVHGVWERTGWKSITFTGLLPNLDASGNLIGLERHRCSFDYSDDFKSYQGKEYAEKLSCLTPFSCPDPLNPTTQWTRVWAHTVSGARVEVVAPPLQ